MESFEQYALINKKKWSELLRTMELGTHTVTVPSLPDIYSFKSVAYYLNSLKMGRTYSVCKDKTKGDLVVTVTIKAQ